MGQAKVTLIGLENFLNMNDMSIFDFLKLPEKVDKVTVENSILMDLGEYEPLWGEPLFFRNMVGVWSEKWAMTFQKWSDVLNLEYNPIENYDRQEEWIDEEKNDNTSTGSNAGNIEDHATNQQDVSAFNDTGFDPSNRSTITSGTITSNSANSSSTETKDSRRSGRVHGNIGVTTSQRMVIEQTEVAQLSVYQHIIDMFAKEFLLLVED